MLRAQEKLLALRGTVALGRAEEGAQVKGTHQTNPLEWPGRTTVPSSGRSFNSQSADVSRTKW